MRFAPEHRPESTQRYLPSSVACRYPTHGTGARNMKLSKIAKLCVRAKRVYLYDDPERGIQWVGDGHG